MATHKLCSESELSMGEKRAFKIADEHILLFRLADGFYATQARCTHLFKSMEKGKVLDDDTIQCPLHRAAFDIRTGEAKEWAHFPPGVQLLNVIRSEKALKTYTIKLDNGDVLVELEAV